MLKRSLFRLASSPRCLALLALCLLVSLQVATGNVLADVVVSPMEGGWAPSLEDGSLSSLEDGTISPLDEGNEGTGGP